MTFWYSWIWTRRIHSMILKYTRNVKRSRTVELCCFLCCWTQQAVEQSISDSARLMWHHWYGFSLSCVLLGLGFDKFSYRKVSNIRRTLVSNKIVDHSDVVGASPVGAAPTTSSFSTEHVASVDLAKTSARRDEKRLCLGIGCALY